MTRQANCNSCAANAGLRAWTPLGTLIALFLSGCTVGPKYVRPTADVPPEFKESGDWKTAQPSDAVSKGKWWQVFEDPQLDALEYQVSVSNQNLKIAQAQFLEARAALKIARSNYFPAVTGGISATHYHLSEHRPLATATTDYTDYQLPVDVSYEPDVWGRVRRAVEASRSKRKPPPRIWRTSN